MMMNNSGNNGGDRSGNDHNNRPHFGSSKDHVSTNSNLIKRIASVNSMALCEATVASSVSSQQLQQQQQQHDVATSVSPTNNNTESDTSRPSATATATITTINTTIANTTSNTNTNSSPSTTLMVRDQRSRLQQQAFHLSIASGASAGILVISTVPAQVLVLMGIVMAFFMSLMYTVYQRGMLEYNAMLHGRGLGDALPGSIFDQLVNMSLHEYMMGTGSTSMFQEYGFLLLYFVPGLSSEQIEAYVNRLNPQHRDMLRQRGLGNMLGNGFMRFLVGDERLNAIQEEGAEQREAVTNSTAVSSTRVVPRRLNLPHRSIDDDETSELGVEGTESHGMSIARFLSRRQIPTATTTTSQGLVTSSRTAPTAATTTVMPRNNSDSDLSSNSGDEEATEDEFNILADAFTASVAGYTGLAVRAAFSTTRSVISTSMNFLAGTVSRASLSMSVLSAGIGLFGMWAGVYDVNQMSGANLPRRPLRIPGSYLQYFPSATMLWNTTMATSATSSLLVMVGLGRTQSTQRSSNKQRKNKK